MLAYKQNVYKENTMKKLIYTLLCVTRIVQSAAEKDCNDCLLRHKAQLPFEVEKVLQFATKSSFDKRSQTDMGFGKYTFNYDTMSLEIKKKSSMEALFEECLNNGFNETLTLNVETVKKAYELFEHAKQSPPANSALQSAKETSNIDLIQQRLRNFSIHFILSLTNEAQQAIPGIQFVLNTPDIQFFLKAAELVEINETMPILSQEHQNLLKATLLASAFSIRLQFEKYPDAFAQKYAHFQ
jgi:hypothetical protein